MKSDINQMITVPWPLFLFVLIIAVVGIFEMRRQPGSTLDNFTDQLLGLNEKQKKQVNKLSGLFLLIFAFLLFFIFLFLKTME